MADILGINTIAKGKQVVINTGQFKIKGVLDEEITLNLASSFEKFLPNIPGSKYLNQIGQILGNATGGAGAFSTQFKQLGFQSWQGSDPLQFTAQLGFYATYNAYEQVWRPVTELCKLALPGLGGAAGTLIPPGPSIVEVFKDEDGQTQKKPKRVKSADGTQLRQGGSISMTIGTIIRLPKIIVTKAEPTYSSNVDSTGNPIWGRVALDISTIFSAYKQMLDKRPGNTSNQ